MTLKTRIIPCLDVADGRVVKGVNFVGLRDAGDPVESARAYDAAGADELCFLDIHATVENRGTMFDVVRRTAEQCYIPLTVGGGVNSFSQVLGAMVVEGDFLAGTGWVLRAGGGLDFASTPESGDKVQADGFTAPALNLRLSHPVGSQAEAYAGASRRSRFPSLRELYSGALGKFVPNGDLLPEQQP